MDFPSNFLVPQCWCIGPNHQWSEDKFGHPYMWAHDSVSGNWGRREGVGKAFASSAPTLRRCVNGVVTVRLCCKFKWHCWENC
jgi:hypothetical protein